MNHRHGRYRGVIAALTVAVASFALVACASGAGGSPYGETRTPEADESPEAAVTDDRLLGMWGETDDGEPYLTFEADGRVSGSDGCNQLVGTWESADDIVTFSDLAQTMMACEGVDTWLSQAATAMLDGDDELAISNSGGDEIGTLQREG